MSYPLSRVGNGHLGKRAAFESVKEMILFGFVVEGDDDVVLLVL